MMMVQSDQDRLAQVGQNYDVAVEVLNARRLGKGYSDTHARGELKFDHIIVAVPPLALRADGGLDASAA